MKNLLNVKSLFGLAGALLLVVSFNNCGEGFVGANLSSDSSANLFSRAGGESCETALLRVYEKTYHPFVTQTCGSCHTNGPGLGDFGSKDLATSYTSFSSIGADKINKQALNNNHKPPATGDHNTAKINELSSYWGAVQQDYLECVSSEGGGTSDVHVVTTSGKTVPANLTGTTFVKIEWDLETESSKSLPLVAGIEIRKADIGGTTRGYEFRNPTLRLKSATTTKYSSRALNILLNGKLHPEITTYSNIDKIVDTTTALNLSPASANAFLQTTPDAADQIALDFSSLKVYDGSGSSGTPAPGGGTGSPMDSQVPRQTFTQLIAPGGIFANSCVGCHNASRAAGGLDITNYNAAKTAAPNIRSRMNNASNPMPTGGLLPTAQRDIVNAWIASGTPQ